MYNKDYCYTVGNFFSTVRGLTAYFGVSRKLTMKLFPAKISKRATLQKIYSVRG